MRVQVDEPGSHDHPGRIDAVGVGAVQPGHGLQHAVAHDELAGPLPSARRIDQPGATQVEVGHEAPVPGPTGAAGDEPLTPASRYSSAIRIATPFVTWSVMTDCAPAATSSAISTRSFIGPGCMTRAPS